MNFKGDTTAFKCRSICYCGAGKRNRKPGFKKISVVYHCGIFRCEISTVKIGDSDFYHTPYVIEWD